VKENMKMKKGILTSATFLDIEKAWVDSHPSWILRKISLPQLHIDVIQIL
jgi:hypothetical protein